MTAVTRPDFVSDPDVIVKLLPVMDHKLRIVRSEALKPILFYGILT